jgi:hypothetical protein
MVFVTCSVSSQEWIRLSEAAQLAFPNEVLSAGEVTRRLALIQLLCAESERNMGASVRD